MLGLQDGATVLRQSDFSTDAGKGGNDQPKEGKGWVPWQTRKGFSVTLAELYVSGPGAVISKGTEMIQCPGMCSVEPPHSLVTLREGVNL